MNLISHFNNLDFAIVFQQDRPQLRIGWGNLSRIDTINANDEWKMAICCQTTQSPLVIWGLFWVGNLESLWWTFSPNPLSNWFKITQASIITYDSDHLSCLIIVCREINESKGDNNEMKFYALENEFYLELRGRTWTKMLTMLYSMLHCPCCVD